MIRRAHLCGNAMELVPRRIVLLTLVAWLPLLVLSLLSGRAWGDAVTVPFLRDISVHVRFLVALPLLILAEVVVHQRMRPIVHQFLARGLIRDTSRARFEAAVASALRLRRSAVMEVLLVAVVYLVGVRYFWPQYGALDVPTWYGAPAGGGRQLFPAGRWFLYVSLPFFQFVILRWYFRLFIWARFLWQAARCELALIPTHPDRAGGLGFLAGGVIAFSPFLAAHGALLAGSIANQIFFRGVELPAFENELIAVVGFLLVVMLGPLVPFTPHLALARRVGLREYGNLAHRYVRQFDAKWIRGGATAGERLLGSSDIQSLADIGNSYGIVQSMRIVAFSRDTIFRLVAATLLPVAPLILTMMPLKTLVTELVKIVV